VLGARMKQPLIASALRTTAKAKAAAKAARAEATPLRADRAPSTPLVLPPGTPLAPLTPPTPSVPQSPIVHDDFYAVVRELGCAGPTSYELAHKACPWYTLELRHDCFERALHSFDQFDAFATCGDRCACLTMQIFEDVLATGTVAEAATIESLVVAMRLASKLSEKSYMPKLKTQKHVQEEELAMLGALHWRLPRVTPYYILSVLCNEVSTEPKKRASLEKRAVACLTILIYTDAYPMLKQRALAAAAAFEAALKKEKMDFHSVYTIPDLYDEMPAMRKALE
jgi:hypothetical protein